MTYSGFPIFTRRYAFHGLENFAFDLLLGKPCLIVAHHDSFKDGGAEVIGLIEKIGSLNCSVHWRPLGEVIRRSCRRRANGMRAEEVEMYADELLISNPSNRAIEVRIRKRKSQYELVSEILCDEKPIIWATEVEHLAFGERIGPRGEKRFRVVYKGQAHAERVRRSLRFELSVAVRRILSEFRDDYVLTNGFLSSSTEKLKGFLRKAI